MSSPVAAPFTVTLIGTAVRPMAGNSISIAFAAGGNAIASKPATIRTEKRRRELSLPVKVLGNL
jgi:hypothetical protein